MSRFINVKVMSIETLRENLLKRATAEMKPSPIPGRYNATLGKHVPLDNRCALECPRKAEVAKRKARITLAKVW